VRGGLRGLLITAAILAGVYLARSVLVPLLMAGVIAYTVSPLVSALERRRIPRAYGSILVMSGILLATLAIIAIAMPELIRQTRHFSERLPGYRAAIHDRFAPVEAYLAARYPGQIDALWDRTLAGLRGLVPSIAGWAVQGAKGVMASFGRFFMGMLNLIVIPVFTYYLLADAGDVWATVRGIIPKHSRPLIEARARECDGVLRTWLKGQMMVALLLALIYSIGLTLIGVPLGLLIGLLGGLANLVPYLGLVVGFLPAALLSFLDTGSWLQPLLVAGVFTVGQVLEGTVITPRIIGSGLGLPPALVLLAVMVGGSLFGFAGLLLAVPVTAAGLVLIKDMNRTRGAGRREAVDATPRRPLRRRRPVG